MKSLAFSTFLDEFVIKCDLIFTKDSLLQMKLYQKCHLFVFMKRCKDVNCLVDPPIAAEHEPNVSCMIMIIRDFGPSVFCFSFFYSSLICPLC